MKAVRNTEKSDLESIFSLFDHSIHYQERNGYRIWKDYDKGAIIRDIENQYKIVIGSEIGIVFSVAYAR